MKSFEYKEINFNNIKLTALDDISDDTFNKGLNLYKLSHQLNLNKQYKESLNAIFQAWEIGYQSPATFEKAAIVARKLKMYALELEILNLSKKYFKLEYSDQIDMLNEKINWANKRIERATVLNRRKV
ncbi:hypothetical protein [Convivina intestini]|uniref:Uncharacterized protein n=1 Tax=Convivina intestini TaxID=1505726 RepID=A0A2U1D717_9LACO|nr:hypothetical protein [Convivina intestini]PVY83475.1 hypothetical protein C7384_10783 [Convivina intestini]SDC23482.1 hypothetical protein SAMN05216341_1269 [Leuconostocaceae bacterium R-53105]